MRSLDNETLFNLHRNMRQDWIEEDGKAFILEHYDTEMEQKLASFMSDNPEGLEADGLRAERIVPKHVMARAMREGWFHDSEAWRKWANTPEGRAFGIEYGGKVKNL